MKEMDGFAKLAVAFGLLVFWNTHLCVATNNDVFKIRETHNVQLPCDHGFDADVHRINAVRWILQEDGNTEVAQIDRNGKLTVHRSNMFGRVNITFPDGDLEITDVRRTDTNSYKCILAVNGGIDEKADWRKLEVLVPPEMFEIRCSGSQVERPGELCSAIKEDQIMALQCTVQSKPISKLLWISPENCTVNITTVMNQDLPDGLIFSGSVVRNLCAGQFCCHASYEVNGKVMQDHKCQAVKRKDNGGTGESSADPLTSDNSWTLYTIIGAALGFLLLLLILFCVCCCCGYKRKHHHYPDICSLPLHRQKTKKVPVVVDVNGDGEPETMALTPFLGPNSTRTGQPVFNFVVDQANEDPNVNRVKVTQDIEPGGEKSRTVEIYKKKDSFLQPDFKVPPGVFRRALSNSDVSKIVYKETVDENGRTKRELDIIKSDDMENEVESRNEVRAAGSTGSSYQRQLSIHPSSSESDMRKVRFQRQDTVMDANDDVDGFVYLPRASEVTRRQIKYQQSVSVDIDDVD